MHVCVQVCLCVCVIELFCVFCGGGGVHVYFWISLPKKKGGGRKGGWMGPGGGRKSWCFVKVLKLRIVRLKLDVTRVKQCDRSEASCDVSKVKHYLCCV